MDGGYAEYFLAEAAFAAPLPEGVDPREAAPLTCAGVTTYKAVEVGGVRPTYLVLVSTSAITTGANTTAIDAALRAAVTKAHGAVATGP